MFSTFDGGVVGGHEAGEKETKSEEAEEVCKEYICLVNVSERELLKMFYRIYIMSKI